MEIVKMTLCLIYDDSRILLGMKKRGFGAGRWNGFGGKVRAGESIEEALRRELAEEVGVVPRDVTRRAVFHFNYEGTGDILEVHVYSARSFEGSPRESEEMSPQWFLHRDIPYDSMWPDDSLWLPHILAGKNLEGEVYFRDHNTILSHSFREVYPS